MANEIVTPWGRVDAEGNVFVKDGENERSIGQYLGGDTSEALEFYQRKFEDLAGQVQLLEQRATAGAKSRDLSNSLNNLIEQVTHADALGDLHSLVERLNSLKTKITELGEQEKVENEKLLEESRAARTQVVEQIEALAATESQKIRWKDISQEIDQLFSEWKQLQKVGPRMPKPEADALWDRFRKARQTLETAKRAYFADLDQRHKQAKSEKTLIVEKAEALVSRGADAAADYRQLLNAWKKAGRAGKKQDTALWERFKAAGDEIFQLKAEADKVINEEYEGNFQAKQDILQKYQDLLQEDDVTKAKDKWLKFLAEWEQFGRVPRDKMRKLDEDFKQLDTHVKKLEELHWKKNNPETKARVNDLTAQLNNAIEKLELEISAAKSAGNEKLVKELEESLKARKLWLNAVDSE